MGPTVANECGTWGEGRPADPSLDLGTQLVLSLVLDAGEAVLYRAAPQITDDRDELSGPATSPLEGLTDAEVEALIEAEHLANFERATRRAKRESRRYIVANRLRFMWVATRAGGCGLHGPEGRRRIMVLAAAWVRQVRTQLGQGSDQDFPYWYSPELHPAGKPGGSREVCPDPDECGCGGHGWHLNLFVRGPIPHADMKRLWCELDPGNGYEMRYKDWTLDSRVRGLPMVEKLRAGARYGSKYASKDWSEQALAGGAHRYEVGEGFRPRTLKVAVVDRAEAEALLAEVAGVVLAGPTWSSADLDDWPGPVCWGYEWSPRDVRGP